MVQNQSKLEANDPKVGPEWSNFDLLSISVVGISQPPVMMAEIVSSDKNKFDSVNKIRKNLFFLDRTYWKNIPYHELRFHEVC